MSPSTAHDLVPPLCTQARQAVERAWTRAIAAGTLPPLPDGTEAPAVEIERPANPEHGDLSTNLAMKLARPYRRAPLEIARTLADELGHEVSRSPWCPSANPPFHHVPGSLGWLLPDRGRSSGAISGQDHRDPGFSPFPTRPHNGSQISVRVVTVGA